MQKKKTMLKLIRSNLKLVIRKTINNLSVPNVSDSNRHSIHSNLQNIIHLEERCHEVYGINIEIAENLQKVNAFINPLL